MTEILIVVTVLGIIVVMAIPYTFAFYRRVAVEYETERLLNDLRYVQALSRTTTGDIRYYGIEVRGSRQPKLRLRATSYELVDSREQVIGSHNLMPAIIAKRRGDGESGIGGASISFDSNGGLNNTTNMTLIIYARGYENEGQRIVIDNAARIRIERGD